MKELDELKESIDSLEKRFQDLPPIERALLSDCFRGVVKVLEKLSAAHAIHD